MRSKKEMVVITCNACNHVISPLDNYFHKHGVELDDVDLCLLCLSDVMETLLIKDEFDPELIRSSFNHYAILARRNNTILC